MDQNTLIQQYFWVGISSVEKNMTLAHRLNVVLHLDFQRLQPIVAHSVNAKKLEYGLYVAPLSPDMGKALLLQNRTGGYQLMPQWSAFDYFLLLPKCYITYAKIDNIMGAITIIFDYFIMPDFPELNAVYQRNKNRLSEIIELYFLQNRDELGPENYMW